MDFSVAYLFGQMLALVILIVYFNVLDKENVADTYELSSWYKVGCLHFGVLFGCVWHRSRPF